MLSRLKHSVVVAAVVLPFAFLAGASLLAQTFTCPGTRTISADPITCLSAATAVAANATTVTGVYGNEKRDNFIGPNFRTVDLFLIKHTPITERVMSELRVKICNVFNLNNYANPTSRPPAAPRHRLRYPQRRQRSGRRMWQAVQHPVRCQAFL